MPTYAYRCESCGHEFEQFQSIKAEPVKVCPQCSRPKVRRLIGTGAAVLFKGNGFYTTDYRSKTYTEAAKGESGTTSTSKSDSSAGNGSSGDKSAGAGSGSAAQANGSQGAGK